MHGANLFPGCSTWYPAPDPCVSVTLPGGIELLAEGVTGHSTFTLSSWDGWSNGSDVMGGATAWGTADGGIEGNVFFAGRNLMFSGMILAESPAEMWAAIEDLNSVLTDTRWGDLRVDEQHLGLARQIRVARGGRPVITPLTDRVAEYQIQFQSADFPRLGVDEHSAIITTSGVSLTNHGNYPAELVVEMRGPLSRPVTLEWDGGTWEFAASVGSTQSIDVNMKRRLITSPDSYTHYRQYATGKWLELPPGSTWVRRVGGGAGSLRAVWRSSWA